jgi:hypothetical protein
LQGLDLCAVLLDVLAEGVEELLGFLLGCDVELLA